MKKILLSAVLMLLLCTPQVYAHTYEEQVARALELMLQLKLAEQIKETQVDVCDKDDADAEAACIYQVVHSTN